MSLSSNVSVNVTGNYSLPADLAPRVCNLLKAYSKALTSGVAANQADMIFHDRRTLAAAGTEDLDLAGGLADLLTAALMTFARLKVALFIAAAANTGDLEISRGITGVPIFKTAGDAVTLKPGGIVLIADPGAVGYPVTPATGNLITVTNVGAGDGSYDVVLIGASA